jgi:hypothetical protein
MRKNEVNLVTARAAFTGFRNEVDDSNATNALLIGVVFGIDNEMLVADNLLSAQPGLYGASAEAALRLLHAEGVDPEKLSLIHDLLDILCLTSQDGNLYAAVMLPITVATGPKIGWERAFLRLLMLTLSARDEPGPYRDFCWNILEIADSNHNRQAKTKRSMQEESGRLGGNPRLEFASRMLRPYIDHNRRPNKKSFDEIDRQESVNTYEGIRDRVRQKYMTRAARLSTPERTSLLRNREQSFNGRSPARLNITRSNDTPFWVHIRSDSEVMRAFAESAANDLFEPPLILLEEMIRSRILPTLPRLIDGLINESAQRGLADQILMRKPTSETAYHAGFLILMTLWRELHSSYNGRFDAINILGPALSHSEEPPIRVALAVRALCLDMPDGHVQIRSFLRGEWPEGELLRSAYW